MGRLQAIGPRGGVPSVLQRLCVALVLSTAMTACDDGETELNAPLSAVLITLDTTRADALGCYGGPSDATPRLDALAAEGVLYESASTVTPLTLPSHCSMQTGLYPMRHTVRDNGIWALPDSAETLAEAAHEAGIETAAFISAVVLTGKFGLDQGFELYDVPPMPAGHRTGHYPSRSARETVDRAIAWLDGRDPERPFFLWVHLFDPHTPYAPPDRWRGRVATLYQGEIAEMDFQLGRLLDALETSGQSEHTVVLAVADHGESLGEHGEETHGTLCYEPTMRVPLILRHPSGPRGRSTETVSVVDVHPTLAQAMGLTIPPDIDGLSLLGPPLPKDRGVYFESYYGHLSYGWSPLAGWTSGGTKYLHSSQPEYFDLRRDPHETSNLIDERKAEVRRAVDEIAALFTLPVLARSDEKIDDSLRSAVQDIGYAAAADETQVLPHPLAPTDRPSPARMSAEHERVLRAAGVFNSGDYRTAEALLTEILAANPENYRALNLLGLSLAYQGRQSEALPHFRRLVAEGPPKADHHVSLGICLVTAGQPEQAAVQYELALKADPDHLSALTNLIPLLQAGGFDERAGEHIGRYERLSGERWKGEGN